jgi:hypothetical protein
MSSMRFVCAPLTRLLRHRLVLLAMMIGLAYLFSVHRASALPPSPGKVPNGNVYSCQTCHLPDPAPKSDNTQMKLDFLAANKTWTTNLANLDSDGDGFTNGEELQDPTGVWAIGKPDPGDVSFVSNPSDFSTDPSNNDPCGYRAIPPAPQLLDIVGFASPAQGAVSFGVSLLSPLPVDFVKYTVKDSGNQTVHSFISASPPFRSDVWNTKSVPDGSYTVTAQVFELRQLTGATPRTSTRSESIAVNNLSPSFGPVGEVVGTPYDACNSETLNGVAMVGASDGWAVGSRFVNGPGDQMFIKHWDGVRWTSVISPNASIYFNTLHGVAAAGANDAWAVGEYDDGSLTQTLIEHWDGGSWKIVPSPNSGTSNNRLAGVAALSANNAWAVGDSDDGSGGSLPLILHWNGSIWQTASAPSPSGANEVTLKGIAAVSANDIWVVGSYTDLGGSILRKTLILHWNGSQWTIVSSPSPGSLVNGLNGVTAITTTDVWAVGYASNGTGDQTLALHWNGTSWQRVASPSPGAPNNQLLGVAAVASSDVWAVGYANENNDGGVYRTLALHWDGAAWSVVTRPYSADSRLNAVAALPTGEAWAAGADSASGMAQALVERYRVTRPTQKVYLPLVRR